MSEFRIESLQEGLAFGARIRGLDRDRLADEAVRKALRQAFETYGMLVFEDVEPSSAMQAEISNVFGPLKEHPVASLARVDPDAMPGVVQINSPANSGGVVELDGELLSHWLPWHYDHCYNNHLNRAGVLRAVEIVPQGGLTGFIDGISLYADLPADLRARIEDKEILYTLNVQYDRMRFGLPENFRVVRRKPAPPEFEAQAAAMPRAIHPAVWTRSTGEKVLHVSPWMAAGIAGDETPEGDRLLEDICQEIRRLAQLNSYHHRWKPTQMIIWDNWRMLHAVSGHDPSLGRLMYRTTIEGDYGLGRFEHDGVGGKILETTV